MASVLFKLLAAMQAEQDNIGSGGGLPEDYLSRNIYMTVDYSGWYSSGEFAAPGAPVSEAGEATWIYGGWMPWLIYTPANVEYPSYNNPNLYRWMVYEYGDCLRYCNDEDPTTGTWYYSNGTVDTGIHFSFM